MPIDKSQCKELPWWRHSSTWVMLLLGFSAGIPILLIFSSLSLWLREAGVSRSEVTFFSWAALGYSVKFVWAPLIDKLPLPALSQLFGRRRAWLLVAQCMVMGSIIWMATINPQYNLTLMAVAATALGFSAATQDIVIDAFRIEADNKRMQAMLSSMYISGYRVAMIVSGAGALYFAEKLGSTSEVYSYSAWRQTYLIMAAMLLVGIVTTLLVKEPDRASVERYPYAVGDYIGFFVAFLSAIMTLVLVYRFVSSLAYVNGLLALPMAVLAAIGVVLVPVRFGFVNQQMIYQGYVAPIKDFFKRYGHLAILLLLLVGFYRISDIVMGVITNVFYQDMGYSKIEIASISKTFGVVMTISGSFVAGFMVLRYGVMKILMLGAVLVAMTNLLFMWLAQQQADIIYLIFVITADNISQGIAVAAFIAWLSSLTNVEFTATQYALFSSLMTLFPKLIAGYSGAMVESIGYPYFFLFASLLGVPVIVLIYCLKDRLIVSDKH